ncbi:MAG TPA: hypothetical protein VMK65_06645 [Longimicrobiales bacterium]|nr:hypothetical protein [Longimicrobiales bacterium]
MTGLDIRPLTSQEDLRACVALQRETWGQDFSELVPPAILLVSQRIGGVTAGAFDAAGQLTGFVFGMTGWEHGRPIHWSDMLAVRPEARDRGVGTLLKRYQRERLLPLGVESVYWTFEPLESKNAYVNFAHLGIVAREYSPNLYGETDSPLHAGLGTDRLVALWPIASERVSRRLAGERAPAAVAYADAPLAIPVWVEDDLPRCGEPRLDLQAVRLRLPVPADIQMLKRRDATLALGWRASTRAAFLHYLKAGYEVCELIREGAWSSYVLERGAP